MTHRITIAIDPGQTGAIAVLADGCPIRLFDMPVSARKSKGNEVSAAGFALEMRGIRQENHGAYVYAVIEDVHAMKGQGVSSMFNFGKGCGVVEGVLAGIGIGYRMVTPQAWKKYHGLIGKDKDVARTLAMQRWPTMAPYLSRKKDGGRADALMIATWAWETEVHSEVA